MNSQSPLPTASKTQLRVSVKRQGTTVVQLALPVSALNTIENLVDPEILAKVQARGVCLEEIQQAARSSGYVAQEIFSLEETGDDSPAIRVWIE